MDDQTNAVRQELETSKQRARVYREWAYFGLAVLVGVMLIWALWSWKHTNDMVGATNAKLLSVIDEGHDLVSDVRVKLNQIDADKINQRLDDLGASQQQLTGLISDVRLSQKRITDSSVARIDQLAENLSSVKGATDEARLQLKQTGDGAAKALASVDTTIKDVDSRVVKLLDDGSLLIETSNPKLQTLLDRFNTIAVDADGTIKAYQPVGVNLSGITEDFHAMTTDSKNKLHEVLYPAPVKGFWPNVKRIGGYLYRPAFDGLRIYYTLHSLPVRVTQPIPIGKP